MLFTSDEDLRRQQKLEATVPRGMELGDVDKRRERLEAERELREHQRWREFAWLLFIAPIWAALLLALMQWLVAKWLAPSP